MPINRDHLPDHLSKMPKALNNEVHALLSEAKKLENSEIVLGRSLKGYDSTFTYSHIHRKKNTGVHTELILTDTRDWSVFGRWGCLYWYSNLEFYLKIKWINANPVFTSVFFFSRVTLDRAYFHLEPNCEKATLNLQLLCKIEMIS